jgi:hypothetical protein
VPVAVVAAAQTQLSRCAGDGGRLFGLGCGGCRRTPW